MHAEVSLWHPDVQVDGGVGRRGQLQPGDEDALVLVGRDERVLPGVAFAFAILVIHTEGDVDGQVTVIDLRVGNDVLLQDVEDAREHVVVHAARTGTSRRRCEDEREQPHGQAASAHHVVAQSCSVHTDTRLLCTFSVHTHTDTLPAARLIQEAATFHFLSTLHSTSSN